MVPCLIEEAFEAADALRQDNLPAAREELGDVLVNLALLASIQAERGAGGIDALAAQAAHKLISRHSHVFGDVQVDGAEMAYQNWEKHKRNEGPPQRSVLAGVPRALPSLLRAKRLGEKAARAGFDWPDAKGPRDKVSEELAELDQAIALADQAGIADELGDVLFSLCNLARHLKIDPEAALARTCDKFQARFAAVEASFDYDLAGKNLDELDAAWNTAKQQARLMSSLEPLPPGSNRS